MKIFIVNFISNFFIIGGVISIIYVGFNASSDSSWMNLIPGITLVVFGAWIGSYEQGEK